MSETADAARRWFGSVAINDAAAWTYDFFQEFDVVSTESSHNA